MRHIRIFSLCLLGLLTAAAVVASGASAKLPEWGQCRETASGTGGKYANAGCTQPVREVYRSYRGAYEWYPLTRTAEEVADGDQTKVKGRADELQSETFKFASGREIRCRAEQGETGSRLPLDGADVMTDAPDLEANGCEEPVLELENHGEEGHTGSLHTPGECHGFGGESEINTEPEFEAGDSATPEGTTWSGKTVFLSGKSEASPSVGISYRTEPVAQHFFPQIVCESGPESESLGIQIGGHKKSERLVLEVTPVNTMLSRGFEAALRPQAKDTTYGIVNAGTYEPVTVEGSFTFGSAVYIGYQQRLAWEEGGGEPNQRYSSELELKATP